MRWYMFAVMAMFFCFAPASYAGYIVDLPDLVVKPGDTVDMVATLSGDTATITSADLFVNIPGTGTQPTFVTSPTTVNAPQAVYQSSSDYLFYSLTSVDTNGNLAPSSVRAGMGDQDGIGVSPTGTTNLARFRITVPTDTPIGTYNVAFGTGSSLFGFDFESLGATFTGGSLQVQGAEVPEPASLLLMAGLMACGAPALVVYRRRRQAATAC